MSEKNFQNIATQIFHLHLEGSIQKIERFPTGLCHYVFDVENNDRNKYVIRVAAPNTVFKMEGGWYWYDKLKDFDLPMPKLLTQGMIEDCGYMILERLPGTDLKDAYADLNHTEKKNLGVEMAAIQAKATALHSPGKFGNALSYEHLEQAGKTSWLEIIEGLVHGISQNMGSEYTPGIKPLQQLWQLVADIETELKQQKPIPYFEDLTTKNVLLHQGKLSGIIDIDEIGFGDPLFVLGMTQTACLQLGLDLIYVESWLEAIKASKIQRQKMHTYSALFCLMFLSELGRTYNKKIEYSKEKEARLLGTFEKLRKKIQAT